ncbi:MAG: alanine--tRNA ligase [Bacteroidales bacterium]|nr:alanine--tRNA ligase [Bacteroidales bacterium]MDD4669511.1 alanine--tRNA ligase [Bacteroidales bacterium]
MTSKEIRKTFLDFFASKGHTIVPSAPMVVKNDPTLMFTNAGMNQFKDWFLGNTPIQYTRVADTQKCLRVSGKHNDLEEVGHDTYHHTMFEMLGNWSFGDYFKKEAIGWAWELLTEVYKLDKSRLYATVFEGYGPDGLDMDTEARDYWLQYLPADRIIMGNKKDNFWEMGDTGPCGPCSEIHIDLRTDEDRAEISGAEMVNKGHHLVIEIWNLVFIQYNRKANGQLEPLPAKHVDTGMGLERLCMALEGKFSNYETDVFTNMLEAISRLSNIPYNADTEIGIAMRVIADHIRAISFSITDGQLPSNVKAGYVIRRILRRAVRYGYTFLNMHEPFLCKLVPQLVSDMGEAFPELTKQQALIERVIKDEEEAFLRTLDKGIKLMDVIMEKSKGSKIISGEDAFTLYDTFGFPIDLSELIAKENGYTIDMPSFEVELGKQKQRARNATAVEEGDWIQLHPFTACQFTGYDNVEEDVSIMKYRTVKAKNKELYQLVFDKTPFYAESGGQVGDSGYIESASGEKITIINTIKENNLFIHIADRIPVSADEQFHAVIDLERRTNITNNHSATHLLHFALRQILGTHIEQKGSAVNSSSFRFDFSHYEKISPEHLKDVEHLVNKLIRQNVVKQEFRNVPIEQARQMGAMALFGEKYGNSVRVIKFGDSIELCGGTHAAATGQIGFFKIISESAVAAGIRRIEATTGAHAETIIDNMEDRIASIKELFGNSPDMVASVIKLIQENESFRKTIEDVERERMIELKESLIKDSKILNGIRVLTLRSGYYIPDAIKNVAFMLYKELTNSVFVAAFETPDKKACLTLMYTDDLVKNGANAANDIKEVSKLIQGGGGGQNFLATAGGKNIEGLSEAAGRLIELATK